MQPLDIRYMCMSAVAGVVRAAAEPLHEMAIDSTQWHS